MEPLDESTVIPVGLLFSGLIPQAELAVETPDPFS